ncbi:pyridoxamine 5'-phosphate oxidase family protein [Streptomyces sp. NPDC059349]|uniref:pyridoxamine 5'-phosphate oxidase family protein n=1 Tax=Streptomyces sp. NPDC059349 TaxID=3346808 RepID=UPI0036A0576E
MTVLVPQLVDLDAREFADQCLGEFPSPAEVVVYEADQIDLEARTGWSVMVTGRASLVTDPLDVARYQQLLTPWIDIDMDHVIQITAEIVTGYA